MNQYKPELGRFYGDSNPEVWVFQAERYFNFYGFYKDSWLSMPYVYFKGEARAWFDWLYRNDQFWDWKHFTEKLALHYRKYAIADSMRCPTVSSQASYTNVDPMGPRVSSFADQRHSSRSHEFSSMSEVEKPKAHQMFEEMYDGIFTSVVEISSSVTAAASQSIHIPFTDLIHSPTPSAIASASHETGKSEIEQVFDNRPKTYSAYLDNDSNGCTTELTTLGNQICESGDATSLVKSEMAVLEEREVVANPYLSTPKERAEVDGSSNNEISCLCRYDDAQLHCEICISGFMVGSKPAASDNAIEKATMVISPVILPDLIVGKFVTTKVLDGSSHRTNEGKYVSSTDASNSYYSDNALNTMSAELINVHQLPPDHFGFDFPFDPGSHFLRSYGSSVIVTISAVEVIKIAAQSPNYFGMLKLTMGEFLDHFSVPIIECIRDTFAAAIRKTCELIRARVVFWDMRESLVIPLFQGGVDSASILSQLDDSVDELRALTDNTSFVFDPGTSLRKSRHTVDACKRVPRNSEGGMKQYVGLPMSEMPFDRVMICAATRTSNVVFDNESKLAFFIYLWCSGSNEIVADSFFKTMISRYEIGKDRTLLVLKTRAWYILLLYCQNSTGATQLFFIPLYGQYKTASIFRELSIAYAEALLKIFVWDPGIKSKTLTLTGSVEYTSSNSKVWDPGWKCCTLSYVLIRDFVAAATSLISGYFSSHFGMNSPNNVRTTKRTVHFAISLDGILQSQWSLLPLVCNYHTFLYFVLHEPVVCEMVDEELDILWNEMLQFAAIDWLIFQLQLYWQDSLRLQRCHKLERQLIGSFDMLMRLAVVADKLEFLEVARLYLELYIPMLESSCDRPNQLTMLLQNLEDKVLNSGGSIVVNMDTLYISYGPEPVIWTDVGQTIRRQICQTIKQPIKRLTWDPGPIRSKFK